MESSKEKLMMINNRVSASLNKSGNRVEGRKLVLDAEGEYPMVVCFVNPGDGSVKSEYQIIKTKRGKWHMIK
jgi:hypothetical protein